MKMSVIVMKNYADLLAMSELTDRKSTRLNSSHTPTSRMPSSFLCRNCA